MPPENQSQRILIVEDEDNARKGYEANLRKLNFEVLGLPAAKKLSPSFRNSLPM